MAIAAQLHVLLSFVPLEHLHETPIISNLKTPINTPLYNLRNNTAETNLTTTKNNDRMAEEQEQTEEQQLLANRALFAQTLTFNVIGRYDPKLSNLLFTSGNSQIYEYVVASGDWLKLPYKGPLAVYSRDDADDGYDAGIIVLNKEKMENFSIGIITLEKSKQLGKEDMKVENTDTLTVVKDSEGKAYGIWIQDDREPLCTLIKTLIEDTTIPTTTTTE